MKHAGTTTRPTKNSNGYLPTLDGWRAIAVAMVCVSHTRPFPGYLSKLNKLRDFGDSGVNLFFAISGILICSRLLEEEKITGRISLIGFYIRRAFRILPAAYLFLAIIALMALSHITPHDWHGWWAAVLLYRNYLGAAVGDTNTNRLTGHFWSLSIEEHFYLLLPFLLVALPRYRKLALGLLLTLSLAWLGLYLGTTPPAMRQLIWIRRTDLRIWCLILPALLALFLQNPRLRAWFVRYLYPSTAFAPFILYVCFHFAHKFYFHIPSIPPPPFDPHSVAVPITTFDPINGLIAPLLMPFLILSTMLHPEAWLSQFLEWQPMRAIGRVSYGIYLWQQIYFNSSYYPDWPLGRVPQILLAGLVILCILSSYFLVEKPLIRLGHRLAPPVTPGHLDLQSSK